MDQPNETTPDFSPSILHNKKGPMNSSYRPFVAGNYSNNSRPIYSVIPKTVGTFMADRRVLALVCFFLPPLAVLWKTGFSRKFGLSLILFAFFIFPGTRIYRNTHFIIVYFIYRSFIRFLCKFFGILSESIIIKFQFI